MHFNCICLRVYRVEEWVVVVVVVVQQLHFHCIALLPC
jgi:hypothetical protein